MDFFKSIGRGGYGKVDIGMCAEALHEAVGRQRMIGSRGFGGRLCISVDEDVEVVGNM